MRALELPTVDYFSLDIEGAEYQVLKTLPFSSGNINLFGIETAHAGKIFDGSEDDIMKLLEKNGYEYVAYTRLDKFFQKQIIASKQKKKRNIISIG